MLGSLKTEQSLPSASPLKFKCFDISEGSCVIRLNSKRAGQCRPQNNALVMHCSTLCYITLITALLQLSLQQKREHCRIVLYLRNGVSTGKGGIYFRRFGLVCYSYCRITRFCCHWEFTLPLAYFAVSACIFFALPPSRIPAFHRIFVFSPKLFSSVLSPSVIYMFIHITKKKKV